ncbi:hypothetical protein JW962_02275 [Candidatus Dojkabacteria bacterium]|nr:hypothetical protein [Candidatus Dojkabacteria bacterium]
MGLLDSVFDSLLPKQSRPAQGRPFIDIGQQGAQVADVMEGAMAPINALVAGPIDNVINRANIALYSPRFTVGLDYKNLNVSISPQFIVQALDDPNKAVESAINFSKEIAYGASAPLFGGGKKWANMISSLTSWEKERLLKYSLAKAGHGDISDSFRRRVLDLWNNNDIMHTSNDARALAFAELAENSREILTKAKVSAPEINTIEQYLGSFNDASRRNAYLKRIGIAQQGKASKKRGDRLKALVDSDLSQLGLDVSKETSSTVQSIVGTIIETESGENYQSLAFDHIIRKLSKGSESERALAIQLTRIKKGQSGWLGAINLVNDINAGRLAWSKAETFPNLFLNGDLLKMLAAGRGADKFRALLTATPQKWKDYKLGKGFNKVFALAYIAHPGVILRSAWDGDWAKMVNLLFGKKILPELGIKGRLENFVNKHIAERGVSFAINIAQKMGMAGLAKELQKVANAGWQNAAKSVVQYAIRKAFQSVSDAFVKLAMKFGTKGLIHGALQAIGSAVPVIGNLVAAVVGWVVAEIVEKIGWAVLEISVKSLLLVAVIMGILIAGIYSTYARSGAFMPNDVIPGQVGSGGPDRATVPGGNTSILDGTAGGGYAIDYNASLTQLKLDYPFSPMFDSIKCTQGYKGATSHRILVQTKNTYAVDIAPTDGTKMVKAPVSGTVSIYRVGLSQDYVIIKEKNHKTGKSTGAQFVIVHIDAKKCVIKSGASVNAGDPLCELFSLAPGQGDWVVGCGIKYSQLKTIPGPGDGQIPDGCTLRWSGEHVHVFARTPSGAPVDVARYVGIGSNSVCPE